MADTARAALLLAVLHKSLAHFLPILSRSLLRGLLYCRLNLFGLLDGLGLLDLFRGAFHPLSDSQRFAYPSPDLLYRLGNPLDRR